MARIRLQKLLAQANLASRRSAEAMITAGEVKINGVVVTTLGTSVDPNSDKVEVGGKRVRVAEKHYRVLLKPRGCLSTLEESSGDLGRPTLFKHVPDVGIGFTVVAPLDYLSEGVLLLTTDGDLAERMSRGGGRVNMTYHLKLQGMVKPAALEKLERGWHWNGRPVKPVKVEALATTGKNTWVEIVVPESRPRVLKSAGDSIRHTVLKISRLRMGDISFEGLGMGMSRDLTKQEVKSLLRDAGVTQHEGAEVRSPNPAKKR